MIIGGGPGGYEAALVAAQLGAEVTRGLGAGANPTLAREWPSPDGKRKALEQHFDCPGWYALKIEITNSDKTKAVVFDDRPIDQVRPSRWPDLKVEWKSNQELWITDPPRQDTTGISSAVGVNVHCVDGAVMR